MSIRVEDSGLEDFLSGMDVPEPQAEYVLENVEEYAAFLHNRLGYWVIDEERLLDAVDRHLIALVESGEGLTQERVDEAMARAVDEEVAYLQSFTGQMRPPVTAGGPQRPAHPGGWADRTTRLAAGFRSRINDGPLREHTYSGTRYL